MRMHWPLINLGLLFILPLVLAGGRLAFSNLDNLHTIQAGTFVQHPVQVPLTDIEYIAGDTIVNKWTIIYVASSFKVDTTVLQQLKNLHVALGASSDRVAIIAIKNPVDNSFMEENNLFILNPKQMWIMQYQDLTSLNGVLKDMRRLLKYSHA